MSLNGINRFKFTPLFMQRVTRDLKLGLGIHPFIRKFKPILKNGKIFVEGKPLIPQKNREKIIGNVVLHSKAPASIHGVFKHIHDNIGLGISRRDVRDVFQKDPTYQKITRRGARKSNDKKHPKDQKTKWVFRNHPNTVGIDLIDLGKTFTPEYTKDYKYLCVVVHKYSGFTYMMPLKNKTNTHVFAKFFRIIKYITKDFGKPTLVEHDQGYEFQGKAWRFWFDSTETERKDLKKVGYVEAKNSQLQRTMSLIQTEHSFEKLLGVTLDKVNNTVNRTTGVTPDKIRKEAGDFRKKFPKILREYKNKEPKRLRVFKKGDRVRYLLARARRGEPYKSYKGNHWSKSIHTVLFKRQNKYKITEFPYMLLSDELLKYKAEQPFRVSKALRPDGPSQKLRALAPKPKKKKEAPPPKPPQKPRPKRKLRAR